MRKYLELLLKYKKRIICIILAVVLCVCVFNLVDQSKIDVTFYQVQSSKVSDSIRIVTISDLHLREFGKDNIRLVEQIKSLHPDLIACVGDSNKRKKSNYDEVITLFKQLVDVAPVYYSLGNHEYEAMLFRDSEIDKDLQEIGVHVLNDKSEVVQIKSTKLNIGGLSQGPDQFERYGHDFFDKYIEEDYFKLLLCHYPHEFQGVIEQYPIDLAICGHAHGGLIRLPGIGGVYAPGQGMFPELTEGYHEIENSKVIICRGLGNSNILPRINNRPELAVIDLCWY